MLPETFDFTALHIFRIQRASAFESSVWFPLENLCLTKTFF
jgi:hypothetical protein